MNTLQEQFIEDMESNVKKTLNDYIATWEAYLNFYELGTCREEAFDKGMGKLRNEVENKLVNLGYNRVEALLLMAKAIQNRAELENEYQGGFYE